MSAKPARTPARFTAADGTKYVETAPGRFDFDRTPEEAAAAEAWIIRWRKRLHLKMAREHAIAAWERYMQLKVEYAQQAAAEEEAVH